MSYLNTIPKDLPETDPLLFSFLVIMDAVQFQVKLDGKQELKEADLPAFNYAVNSWKIVEEEYKGSFVPIVQMDVLAAIWKNQPKAQDCKIVWSNYPDGSTRVDDDKGNLDMPFKYEFENWRNQTFDELDQIISGLTFKGEPRDLTQPHKPKLLYLPNLFGWEILNNEVKYVYAGDETTSQMYGVGAAFVLKSPYMNCCPKLDETKLTKAYFESIGFTMEQCFNI